MNAPGAAPVAAAGEGTSSAAAPSEGQASDERRMALVLDEASWWVAKAATERFPCDRLCLVVRCGACEAQRAHTLLLPHPRLDGSTPLFRGSGELSDFLAAVFESRPQSVQRETWEELHRCVCGAPDHHRRVGAVALFRMMIGTGAGLAVTRLAEGEQVRHRLALGGAPERLGDEESIEDAFGRPLDGFETWAALAERLPPPAGEVAGVEGEPGVWMVAGHEAAHVLWALDQQLEGRSRIAVAVTPTGVDWPSALAPIVELAARGSVVVALERERVIDVARAYARFALGMDLEEGSDGVRLRGPALSWPVRLDAIALRVAKLGVPIAWAAAAVLNDAAEAGESRVETLRKLVQEVPGAGFEVEGTRVVARRPDGSRGRAVDLRSIPPGDVELSREELARQAAFIFELAPAWADPTRVCPCGAAATVERRLVGWPWAGDPEAGPAVLELVEASEGRGAALVAAIACERHVRIPSAAELARIGLDDETRERRLVEDAPRRRQRVRAWVQRFDAGPAILAEGPLIGIMALDDGRLAALHRAMGEPLAGEADVLAWALGEDVVAVGRRAAIVDALETRGRLRQEVPFLIERRVDLETAPSGLLEIEGRRG